MFPFDQLIYYVLQNLRTALYTQYTTIRGIDMTIKNLKNQSFVVVVNNRGAGKPKQSPIFWRL